MASCPRCGAEQSERTAFCSACGALIDRPNTEAPVNSGQPPPPPPTARPTARPVEQGGPPPPQPAVLKARSSQPVSHDFGDVGIYIVRRFLALIVDLAGIGILIGLGLIATVDATRPAPDQFLAVHARDFAIAFGVAVFAYLTIAEALFGSTVGKGLFGLGVCRVDGRRLGFARAFVRNILLPLDLAIVGFLVATVTSSRRRIGDLVAGSVVTNARIGRLATITAAIVAAGAAWLFFANADGVRMSSQLLAVAGLQMPAGQVPVVEQARPSPSPTIEHLRPPPSDEPTPTPTPTPTPSADPGKPHTV
jgi:uncharacterized RDD family membrane protein YckC